MNQFALAEVTVALSTDLGVNDKTYDGLTHLGHLLNAGDYVLGYPLNSLVFNDMDLYVKDTNLPDFVSSIRHYVCLFLVFSFAFLRIYASN